MQFVRVEMAGDGGIRQAAQREMDDGPAIQLYIELQRLLHADEAVPAPPRRRSRKETSLPVVEAEPTAVTETE